MVDKYGVENPSQIKDIMNKKQINKTELIEDLKNGFNRKELREKYSCSNGTLLAHIRKYIPEFTFKPTRDKILTKEFLSTTEMSITEMCKDYNLSTTTVWKYIKRYDIQYKKNKNIKFLEDREWLYDQYITKNKSLLQISREINTASVTIKQYLNKYNIKLKERYTERLSNKARTVSDQEIIKLYKSGESCTSIAIMYDCNDEYIRQILIKNNIEREFKYTASSHEKKICNLLDNLNIKYNINIRSIIYPYELDIYIPEYKIAIEINGVYFHSSKFVDKNYHENKRKLCEEKGIRLIQLFEDDLIYKFDIIKSFITNIFNSNDYIHGRKCKIISNINIDARKDFMEKYHIQGYAKCNHHVGLTYKDDLVALMLFEGDILTRYATAKRVQGGFSKLIKNSGLDYIKTFVDLSMFTGETYIKSGFVVDKYISPDYKYVINNKRIHKFNFRKNQFEKKGFKFDPTLTEAELAELNNMHKIYDAGKLRLIWQKYNLEKN